MGCRLFDRPWIATQVLRVKYFAFQAPHTDNGSRCTGNLNLVVNSMDQEEYTNTCDN